MADSKGSILYLDDEAMCLHVFSKLFAEEYDIRIAMTGAEARRALLERPFDIVISDQTMPGLSGTDFLREVAREYPSSVRMLLTGSICVGEALQELGAGIVNIFISKPWKEVDMGQVLLRAISTPPRSFTGVTDGNFARSSRATLAA